MNGARWVVAGAGVWGAAIAWRLALAGAQVTLCDPSEPGDNASGVAAGMLAPAFEAALDADAGLSFALMMAARDLWPGFAEQAAITLHRDGALWAGGEPASMAARLEGLGARHQLLAPAQAEALSPGLAAPADGAVFSPEDWRVEAQPALARQLAMGRDAGVRSLQASVAAFDGAQVRLSTGARIEADGLVAATGAAAGLAPELQSLRPIKGQIVRSAAGPAFGPVVRAKGVYVVPGSDGVLIGATMQMGEDDRRIEPAAVTRLIAGAASLFPGMVGARAMAMAGVRAASPDGAPLVGFSRQPRIIVAAGARRNGWLLAPLVAQQVVALASGEATASAAFDPRRFDDQAGP